MGWVICHSDHMYCLEELLLVICQFSESEPRGISDFECIFLCPCFKKAAKDRENVSPNETLTHWAFDTALIDRMAERREWIVAKNGD